MKLLISRNVIYRLSSLMLYIPDLEQITQRDFSCLLILAQKLGRQTGQVIWTYLGIPNHWRPLEDSANLQFLQPISGQDESPLETAVSPTSSLEKVILQSEVRPKHLISLCFSSPHINKMSMAAFSFHIRLLYKQVKICSIKIL